MKEVQSNKEDIINQTKVSVEIKTHCIFKMNHLSGIYRKGCAYPLNTRMKIVVTFIQTNGVLATATQCRASEMTVRRILAKYRQQVTLKAGVGGNNRSTVVKDYVQLYKGFVLMIDPKLYLSEIRDYLERDLGLNGPDLPSIMTIQRSIAQRGFTRKKCTRVATERFKPENILRRKAFIEWRKAEDPRQLFCR